MLRTSSVRFLILGSLLVAVAAVAAVASEGSQSFRIRDDCDPATFNAALGFVACITTFDGDTTFTKFLNELTEDKTVGGWRFNPDQTSLDRGERTIIESRAGEVHTFTRVEKFGGGVVPLLNTLSGNVVPAPECLVPATPTDTKNLAVLPGTKTLGPTAGSSDLPAGKTTNWQCCIHPWMRSTITVK